MVATDLRTGPRAGAVEARSPEPTARAVVYDAARDALGVLLSWCAMRGFRARTSLTPNFPEAHVWDDLRAGFARERAALDPHQPKSVALVNAEYRRRAAALGFSVAGAVTNGLTSPVELDADAHDEVYAALAADMDFAEPTANPVAVLLLTQAGTGSAWVRHDIHRRIARTSGAVTIAVEDLCAYHPRWVSLLHSAERVADLRVAPDAIAWAQTALRHAIGRRVNLIYEPMLGHSHTRALDTTVEELRDAGYRVEIVVMSVPCTTSLRAVFDRYLHGRRTTGLGRFTPKALHDIAVEELHALRAELDAGTLAVDKVQVRGFGSHPTRARRH